MRYSQQVRKFSRKIEKLPRLKAVSPELSEEESNLIWEDPQGFLDQKMKPLIKAVEEEARLRFGDCGSSVH